MKYVAMLLLFCAPTVHAADLMFLGGQTVLRSTTDAFEVTLTEPYKKGYSFQEAVSYVGQSKYDDWYPQPSKVSAIGRVVKTWHGIFAGLGLSYASRTDLFNGSALNFNEAVGVTIANHLVVQFEHTSNAGIVKPNVGRNLLLVGYRF